MKSHRHPTHLVIVLLAVMSLIFSTFVFIDLLTHPKIAVAHHKTASGVVRIMPLGDSITAGVGSSYKGGYRVALWNDCMAYHFHVIFVGSQYDGPTSLADRNNEGHPGWRIDQISTHVVAWLQTYQPQIVLLHIGSNDIIQHRNVSDAPARLHFLLEQITTTLPGATVIVAQITPLGNPLLNAEVIAYNRTIPQIVGLMEAQGKHVEYVDMYHAVPASDLADGIHPNNAGYALMAGVWFRALQPIIANWHALPNPRSFAALRMTVGSMTAGGVSSFAALRISGGLLGNHQSAQTCVLLCLKV
jgi:lysophospholipase L1-like esterase